MELATKDLIDLTLEWDGGTSLEDLVRTRIEDWFDEHGKQDKENEEDGIIVTRLIFLLVEAYLANRSLRRKRVIRYKTIYVDIRLDTRLSQEATEERLAALGPVWASLVMEFDLHYNKPPASLYAEPDPATDE